MIFPYRLAVDTNSAANTLSFYLSKMNKMRSINLLEGWLDSYLRL